jgi:tRNA pseudouridine38-40 synthase
MPRYRLIVEYDGRPYAGWQAQATHRAVQDAVEDALFKLTGQKQRVICAGRTDAGVHALGQVISFDLDRAWRPDVLRDGMNSHLRDMDEAVAILAGEEAAPDFSARTGAIRRHYLYRILNRRPPSPLENGRAWHVPRPLDVDLINRGAERLIGHHDFTTFRSADCQGKSPMKTMEVIEAVRIGDIIEIRVAARSFLHNQVRRMVGSLELCGAGRWTPDDMTAALQAKDRQRCGMQAPSWGLFFMRVEY